MTFTIQALADEINNDPLAIGYKNPDTSWKSDQEIVDLINAANYTLNNDEVSASDVRALTTFDAFDGLTVAEVDYFKWLTSGEMITVTDDVLAVLGGVGGSSIWATGEQALMETRMQGILQYTGSRAQQLWGKDSIIFTGQVGQAANL